MKISRYILLFAVFIPIFIFRDFTPDNELKYLSIADEALRNGTIFTFMNHGVPYADKPPLYLWIVMLGKWIFGTHSMLFLGLFSLIPALRILFIMDRWVQKYATSQVRLSGMLMLITSGFYVGSTVVLRMDMLMCLFIVQALHAFYKMYEGHAGRFTRLLFPVFVFLAVFTKGPVGLLVPLFSTVAFLLVKREPRKIAYFWGWRTWVVLFGCSAVWLSGVYIEGGNEYMHNLLFNQTVNRAVDSFHHKAPIYYYLIAIWYSLAPWSLLYIGVLLVGLFKRWTTTDLERFFLTVIAITFVTLSLVSAKLAIYMLPALPFFAYIAVLWISKSGVKRWMLPLAGIPAVVFALAFPGCWIASGYVGFAFWDNLFVPAAALALSVAGVVSLVYLFRSQLNKGVQIGSIGLLATIFIGSFAIPGFNAQIGLGELSRQARVEAENRNVDAYYYYNIRSGENMDIYLDTPLTRVEENELSDFSGDSRPGILFLRKRDIERIPALKSFVSDKEMHDAGGYVFVVW